MPAARRAMMSDPINVDCWRTEKNKKRTKKKNHEIRLKKGRYYWSRLNFFRQLAGASRRAIHSRKWKQLIPVSVFQSMQGASHPRRKILGKLLEERPHRDLWRVFQLGFWGNLFMVWMGGSLSGGGSWSCLGSIVSAMDACMDYGRADQKISPRVSTSRPFTRYQTPKSLLATFSWFCSLESYGEYFFGPATDSVCA